MNRIATDIARAITPPSLFGTDRRTAYANRKYHSGWIRTGVTSGFAGVKLSGSLRMFLYKILSLNGNLGSTTLKFSLISFHVVKGI
jgi:hypothetical protein